MNKSAALIPPADELRAMYADVFNNAAVRSITTWTEPNHSEVTDEEAYLQKALDTGGDLLTNMRRAIEGI